MPEETRPDEQLPEHHAVRREKSDARFMPILYIAVGTMVFSAAAYYGILEFYYNRRGLEDAAKQSPYPLAPLPSAALPAGPRLEQIDRMEGVEKPNVYLRQEVREERLDSYGRTDEDGFVHVPIDRAMTKLLDDHLLPSRAESASDRPWRGDGLVDSGESNSGREFRGKQR